MFKVFNTKRAKWASLILITAVILAAAAPAVASGMWARFVIGQSSYVVNGQTQTMDTVPFIKDGRTFLPIRYVAYAVGVPDSGIAWDGKTGAVTIVKGSDRIVLVIGNATMTKNGKAIPMDVAAFIKDGRTVLPLRFVGEALGAEVAWDAATRTVTLTIGDVTPPPVQPPVQPVPGQIDMTMAQNGTLQPPAGAVAAPSEWGFAPQCREIDLTIGNETATLTALDGSTRPFDLGTAPMVVTNSNSDDVAINSLIQRYPDIYKIGTTVKKDPNGPVGIPECALYAPFTPIAEACGVPAANIEWDGTHLAVFGYYGHADNYRVLTVGSRDVICKVDGNSPAVSVAKNALCFPLVVLNGQPALGITSVSDFEGMLFALPGTPNLINAASNGDSWNYETGTAAEGCYVK